MNLPTGAFYNAALATALRTTMGLALGRRLPRYTGRLAVRSARGPIRIRRDGYGVPYITAESEHDAWFALGFCHAQDRAAQLELTLRAVRGTLSELVGHDGLPVDRLSRRIGFRRAGDAQLALAEPWVAEQVAAYVRGVNEGLAHAPVPHELALLRSAPSRWEPGDVQGYSVLLCFALASNWDIELLRLKILVEDGPEALDLLDAPYPADLPVSSPSFRPAARAPSPVDRLARELEGFRQWVGRAGGSNAWALAGSKTEHGRPLLANDPHLPAAIPPVVYLAQLRCPGLEAAGASWVGVPAFAPGHNGHAAWGATAAHADNTDLFLERVGPDGESVEHDGGFERCEVREERIEVRGARPVVERVLVTPRGPIISPALDGVSTPGGAAISMAATWLARRPYTGLYGAARTRSFAAFRERFARGSASTISYVYADAGGDIGWHLAVEVPRRRRPGALIPRAGWDPENGWHDEPHRCTELPHVENPPEGFVATANNQPVADPHPDLGVDWLDGYRQAAIAEALGARDDWTVARCAALQLDTRSLPWRELKDIVLGLEPADADARLARDLLAAWDGRVASDSSGAAVFELFISRLTRALVQTTAPRAAGWALGRGFTALLPHSTIATRRMAHLVRLIRHRSPIAASWPELLERSLSEAIGWLREAHGPDAAAWRWGRVFPLTLVHPFAEKPPMDLLFNLGPFEGEGDPSTIAQGGLDLADPARGQLWLPSLRAVIDCGDWDRSRFALAGGQSGNPLSPHYGDQLGPHRSGKGIPIAWTEPAIAARAVHTLDLVPGP